MGDKSNWKNKNRNILITAGEFRKKIGIDQEGKPHSSRKGRAAAAKRHFKRGLKEISTPYIDESIFIKQFKKMKKEG